MITRRERLLAEFVNRQVELDRFCSMIENSEKPIMVLWGGGGLGKSALLFRLVEECRGRNLRSVYVDESRHQNYLTVLRTIRDGIGPDNFSGFNDLVNFFTVKNYNLKIQIDHEGTINVASGAVIEGSRVGDIAGVVVKDLNLIDARSDMEVPESERRIRLTEQFLKDFETAVGQQRLFVFFDTIERMPEDTREWVWKTLLTPLLDGRLESVRFVLAGREKPKCDRDLRLAVSESELKPLEEQHIVDYLARRGVSEEHRQDLAVMLLGSARGEPALVALQTDLYLERKRAVGA
jgi:GTPase SAR1 family protein